MRLTCPNCGAQYEVPDEVIPPEGRDVQCSNCGNTWYQAHPDHPELADQIDIPETEPEAEPEFADDTDWAAPEEDRHAEPPAPHDDDPDDTGLGDDDDPDLPLPDEAERMAPEVSDILREEAEREARLRAAEGGGLESQTEMGLDQPPSDDELARRAREARERMARIRGEDPVPAADPDPDPGSRRGLLPDIEEINSSLRGETERQGGNALGPVATPDAEAPRRRGGFTRGFAVVLILGIALGLIYVNAPQIARSVPRTDPMLSAYVALVDEARLWLETTVGPYLPR